MSGIAGSLWADSSYDVEYVEWRNLCGMVMEPDQVHWPWTETMAKTFGMAAGMTFRVGHGDLEQPEWWFATIGTPLTRVPYPTPPTLHS